MADTMQGKIIEHLEPVSAGISVADVRIGLGYTSVRLDNGNIGLAWTAHKDSGSCTHLNKAGTLAGMKAAELLGMLASEGSALARSLGLATANALVAGLPLPQLSREDTLDIIDIQAKDKVVMVGFFGPLIPKIKQTGCKFDIFELKTDRPGTISPDEGKELLAECSVAIITATSIVTGTFDGLMAGLGNPRAVIMLGPSSIMYPPLFAGTPVTHIAGSRVRDAAAVERIISEGGGTMILKKYIDFETICL